MQEPGFQDFYPAAAAHCYGCGQHNALGLQLKTRWEGEETVTRFTPRPEHTATPGFVYGGLLASLIDCHGTGSAAGAVMRAEGIAPEPGNAPRFVTAALKVDFLRPTPLGPELTVRGKISSMSARKVVVSAELFAAGQLTVRGEVVAVRLPESMAAGA